MNSTISRTTEFIEICPLPGFAISMEGLVIAWNQAVARLTGLKAEDMIGTRDHWKALRPDPQPLLCDVMLARASGNTLGKRLDSAWEGNEDEAWGIKRVERPIVGEGMIFSQAGFLRDASGVRTGVWQIYQPLSLMQVLAHSSVLDMVLSKIPDPMAVAVNGRLLCVNTAFADLSGLKDPRDAVGLRVGNFIDDADRERFLRLNGNQHAGLAPNKTYSWKYNVHGKIKHVEGSPTVFMQGQDTILVSTIKDVTETVRRQEKFEQEKLQLEAENRRLLETIERQSQIFVGESPAMRRTLERAVQLSKTDTNLVILGETGSGKSMLARLIHDMSRRSGQPFLSVNCAAIPEQLLEGEFFGHVKGAFTGALPQKVGYLGQAHGGTLFLDEVGELSPIMQSKLLYAVERKKYMPLGGSRELASDVRLICATNRDLAEMLRSGAMREDFFYRIFVIDIAIPALRERRNDLPQLVDYLFDKFGASDTWKTLPNRARQAILSYDWPGNVRELQNVLTRYIVTGELQFVSRRKASPLVLPKDADVFPEHDEHFSLAEHLEQVERELIQQALKANNGRKDRTAEALGINVRTLHRRCVHFGL
ncbi:MAG: sigma 54-interacting transcriptional regulator [Desulfovibrionaceae bacterium]|nr:sigma 54-interacting transcriptional regulator [Desulfovibrionaceae bacterium]